MFQKKTLFLILVVLLLLVVENCDAEGEGTVKPSAVQNPAQEQELPNDNKSRPVKFRRMKGGDQNRLKPGYVRIIRNIEDLIKFFIDLSGPEGATEAAKVDSKDIDFNREVMVAVSNLPDIDRCNIPLDPLLEWTDGDQIKVILRRLSLNPERCVPWLRPEKFRYSVVRYVIDQPVSKVEVVYPPDEKLP